jgi:uncharacterized protein YndB with AHSA1/START domain
VTDNNPLIKEVYLDASPELVFSFLAERDKILRWMGLTLEIDPKPGGIFRLDPNGREVIRGQYLEVIPCRRIVFTWGWEEGDVRVPAGSTIVEIDLIPEGAGTLLRLSHRNLPTEGDVRSKHEFGWSHHLSRLKIVAEGGDPGPDPCLTEEPREIPTKTAQILKEV